MKRFEERTDAATGEPYLSVFARGAALTEDPLLNKGTCFTRAEREELGLLGLLPPSVQTPDEQLARAYGNYLDTGDDVRRYLFLADLQDRNESLFCRLVLDHLPEMVPIIYTPTVGKACEQYSHIFRRARGLYISKTERGRMTDVLRHAAIDDPRVIVLTDNEAILGIGDQGVGGMPIAIGKLALYTVGAGIHPARCLPIDFDAGTDNPVRLDDPLYLGARHRRLRGAEYVALLDELVEAIATVFPHALVQWEDFASANAFAVLQRHRRRLLSFNDDIQGTGAVVVAGIRTGLRRVGRALEDTKIVFFGAGASGAGSALAVRAAMRAAGMADADIGRRVLSLDSKGLIVTDRAGLAGMKRELAVDRSVVAGWTPSPDGTFDLAAVVHHFAPSVLVGVSGQAGAFTQAIIGDLARGCPRPIVLALSNPNSRIEATPADLIRWTNGAAVVGTGGPFAPVVHDGTTHTIGQGNNVFIFPGVGLGATAVGAQWLPDDAFSAAAGALVECTAGAGTTSAGIYPPLSELRRISREVGLAVARTLVSLGAAPPVPDDEIRRRVLAGIWEPVYLPYRAG